MNSVHDFGGMQCYGPIQMDDGHEPPFKYEWERRTFAIHIITQFEGYVIGDACRHEMEKMNPVEYLNTHYYEHWLHATEQLLLSGGILTQQELDERIELLRLQEEPSNAS
ncbi:nitrile hydratase subunit beta [Pseudomonas syringae]|uniref:nitrile hydratase subunit beta n=1 Tax=Pseudomonas syringae TaxID=317 RepID=UPI00215B5904|nr:nitrile hydratase subunit beta [Pseudomonas syringae]MCR8717697.1 nitrile hydratase subunit beta [Pseudomonas syringae]